MVVKRKATFNSGSRIKANEEVIVVQPDSKAQQADFRSVKKSGCSARVCSSGARADVIDLGGPKRVHRHHSVYTPNPRLYPGPQQRRQSKLRSFISSERQGRKRKSTFRNPVPNARLYRPAPARPAAPARPPATSPRTAWPAPSAVRALESASRAALRVAERRHAPAEATAAPRPSSPVRRLRVTLPAMDANRNSTSPDDYSEGNEPTSAPSEFLAEFLSAIMRRQYSEALKYCLLILQYEPHNATARGFYPLLQLKVDRAESGGDKCDSSSEEVSASPLQNLRREEVMEQEADSSSEGEGEGEGDGDGEGEGEGGSCASQSSLELDSSEVLAPSQSSASVSLSRRTDNTDGSGCWESDADDNGNPTRLTDEDLNDNALHDNALHDNAAGTDSLRRLRAHFTCSIK